MKIVLVEWAAYPLERDKRVGAQVVKCGLGRTLEAFRRWPAGVPFELIVIINRADEPSPPASRLCRAWGKLQHAVGVSESQRIASRMRTYARLRERYSFIEAVHIRDNQGQDVGAYDFGYQLLQAQGYRGDVLFMNSSVSGPHEENWLSKYRDQFRRHENVGLCGISMNSHDTSRDAEPFAPHVQSFFLYTNMRVLQHAVGPRLFQLDTTDKEEVIAKGEIGISARVLDAGYRITSSNFPDFAYRRGDAWSIPYGDLRFSPRSAARVPANTI
jgi:rhamnan synthesis protein F